MVSGEEEIFDALIPLFKFNEDVMLDDVDIILSVVILERMLCAFEQFSDKLACLT